jgi:acyl carrier protein
MNEEKLKQLVSEVLDIQESVVTRDLTSDMAETWDSLAHLRLVTAIEQEFSISLTMEEINSMTSYQKMLEYIEKYAAG